IRLELGRPPGEAVRDAADERLAVLRQDRSEPLVRVALVQEDRQAALGGELELRYERALLRVGRGEVAKEVEAALADRDDPRLLNELTARVERMRIDLRRVVRMDARRRIKPGMSRRELRGLHAPGYGRACDDHPGHADRCCPLDHGLAV